MSIDWSKAPEWADKHGYASNSAIPVWLSDEQYSYVDGSQNNRAFSFSASEGWTRCEVKGITSRPELWTGDGLPPVGTVCVITPHNTIWGFCTIGDYPCQVLAYHNDFVWIDLIGVCGVPVATRVDEVDFKLSKTPEQIAAEEREKAVSEMVYGGCGCDQSDGTTTAFVICGLLYDAGYRKVTP